MLIFFNIMYSLFLILIPCFALGKLATVKNNEPSLLTFGIGSVLLSYFIWFLGLFHFYNWEMIFLLELFSILYLIFIFLKKIRTLKNSKFPSINHEFYYTLIVIILWIPTFLKSINSPMKEYDAFYSWNFWAKHWGAREFLGDYYFGYGQLSPILMSIPYKLNNTFFHPLPIEHFGNHVFTSIIYLFFLLSFISVCREYIKNKNNYHLFLIPLLFIIMIATNGNYLDEFISGKPEISLIFFVTLLIGQILKINSSGLKDLSKWQMFVLITISSGLSFTKATGLYWSISLLVVLFIILRSFTKKNLLFITLFLLINLLFPIQQKFFVAERRLPPESYHSTNPTLTGLSSVASQVYKKHKDDFETPSRKEGYSYHRIKGFLSFPVTYSIIIFLGLASFVWLFPYIGIPTTFFIILAFGIWWKYASYGDYNLYVTVAVLFLFSSIGFVEFVHKLFSSRIKKFILPLVGVLTLIILICHVKNLKPFVKSFSKNYTFFTLNEKERLNLFYPDASPVMDELLMLFSEDELFSEGNIYKIKTDSLSLSRLLPSCLLGSDIGPQSDLIIIQEKESEGSYAVGDYYFTLPLTNNN